MENETTWGTLGQETDGYIQPEKTTVTRKIRRVGRWDADLAARAMRANAPGHAVLTFVDYLDPNLAGSSSWRMLIESPAWPRIMEMQQDIGQDFSLFTTGPNSHIWRPTGEAPSPSACAG